MQNLISDPVSMTSLPAGGVSPAPAPAISFCLRQNAHAHAFGRGVYALRSAPAAASCSHRRAPRKRDDHVGRRLAVAVHVLQCAAGRQNGLRRRSAGAVS